MSFPIILTLLIAAVAAVVIWLLIRSRNAWPALPEWSWPVILKLIALAATIAGAAVLTSMAWRLLDELVMMAKGLIGDLLRHTSQVPPPKEVGTALEVIIGAIAWGLKLLLAGVVVVLLSLGMVITPRRFDFRGPGGIGGGFGGGDGETPAPVIAAREVAHAAEAKADQIAAAPAAKPKPDDPNIPDYAKP